MAALPEFAPLRLGIQLAGEPSDEIVDAGGMGYRRSHQMLGQGSDVSGQLPLDVLQLPRLAGVAVGVIAYAAQGLFLFPLAELEPAAWLLAAP